MIAADLNRMLGPLRRRVGGMVARAVVSLVDDAPKAQALQLQLLADETHDAVERFGEYGFTSVPLPGAEAAVMFVGGVRSHGIAIAVEDRRYRLTGLSGGEVALYDDQGQVVKLARGGIVILTAKDVDVSGQSVTIHAAEAHVIADSVRLGSGEGQPVARKGDTVEGGVITGGSSKVSAA